MLETLADALRGLPDWLAVLVVAMAPVAELRGAIPLAVLGYQMPAVQAFFLAVAGNLIPVPIILLFLEPVSDWLRKRWSFADRFFDKLFDRTRTKHGWRFERWRDLALVSFVALPLPLTGAWTGALAAFLFGVRFWRALPLIATGVVIAGCIVTAFVLSGIRMFGIDYHP